MAATHKGNCQICGKQFKVNGDRVSKHGYKVDHGMHLGQCPGAEHKAIQVDCDIAIDTETWAIEQIKKVSDRMAEFDHMEDEMAPVFIRDGFIGGKPYGHWEDCKIKIANRNQIFFQRENQEEWNLFQRGMVVAVDLDRAVEKVRQYRKMEFSNQIRSLTALREHCAETVRTWKPAPLIPIK